MRLILTTLLGAGLALGALAQTSIDPSVVATKLLERMEAAPDDYQAVYFLLNDQVDIEAIDRELNRRKASLEERAYTVITALQQKAANTQPPFLQALERSDLVEPGSILPLWVTNAIYARVKPALVAEWSRDPKIDWIGWNGPAAPTEVQKNASLAATVQPNGKEPGLTAIKAPALWAMGYTGYGMIAYTIDSGVDYLHPALGPSFYGHYVSGDEAWYQSFSNNTTPFECDEENSHGTHVTGTMLGLNRLTNDTTGVAFNARWIASPAIECNSSMTIPTAALQWALNPDGNAGTIDDMPDAINNSWYDPSLDAEDECGSLYVSIFQALEAAGIANISSAGNFGPGPMTMTPPHNININLVNAFTVAAVNANTAALPIANFSSRGPSTCGGTGSLLIKPEVAAPGVAVRSCMADGTYGLLDGTSMASPHVAGAVLLLKEAYPYLTGKEIKEALYFTCVDLGDPGEDNTYGMGIIDVEAAFYYLLGQGNVPADPSVVVDALLVDLQVQTFYCGGQVFASVEVENSGSATLNSLEVEYTVDGSTYSTTWSGNLAPQERTYVFLPAVPASVGVKRFFVNIAAANGQADERPLNNRYSKMIEVIDRDPIMAYAETGPGGEICDDAQVILQTDLPFGPGAVVRWYDELNEGDLLGEGQLFLASAPTTVYAEATYTERIGLESNDGFDFSPGAMPNGEGLVFDADAEFTLRSVKVYADGAGLRIIKLVDNVGNTLKQKVVTLPESGEQRIQIDMVIPRGLGMTLALDLGGPLGYNSGEIGEIPYPYIIDDIVRIRRSNYFNSAVLGLQRYYYFYDWEIEYAEPCGRVPVVVESTGAGTTPEADFSAAVDLAVVDFTDQSTGATAWHWNFGDGATSDESDPTHQYAALGTYQVGLTIVGADGCSDAQLQEVEITTLTSVQEPPPGLEIGIFPNPFQSTLQVDLRTSGELEVEAELLDLNGRTVRRFGLLPAGLAQLSLGELPAGIYLLRLRQSDWQWTEKVIKMNR